MTVIVCLSCSLVKRDLWVVYFHNHVQQSYFNLIRECFAVPYMGVCVCFCKCVCACDYPCCYQRQAAIHSGWNERFSSVTKQFLCFHGAMILSKSQRKHGGGGGEKKNQCPPSPTASLSLAGCRHASTHTNTCIHRQWETQKQRKSCRCDVNCKCLIFFTKGSGQQYILDIFDNSSLKR